MTHWPGRIGRLDPGVGSTGGAVAALSVAWAARVVLPRKWLRGSESAVEYSRSVPNMSGPQPQSVLPRDAGASPPAAAVRASAPGGLALPELLAPAGNWDCARAAVENGADAIYFGLDRFNARMRADNFTEADLPRLLEFLHRRGVRGYVSFNTLVFADELDEAETYLRTCIAAGVDAAIVQDVGIGRLIRRLSPDFPIHASTQMTITSAAGIDFARAWGAQLVVLARECSIAEIDRIQTALRAAPATASDVPPRPLPLEVFVHGALCVAYSGQCLTSEALGGRSANRGECAQACRMPYELLADGQPVLLGDRRYLLSPQDLAGLDLLGELLRVGVASLKIEGRLKSPEYVASITRIYREALDRVAQATPPPSRPETAPPPARPAAKPRSADRYELEMAFSRGLYTGWFHGVNNQELVHGRFGKKRGVYLGAVTRVQRNGIWLRLEGPLKPGDGVVFDAGTPDLDEEGGRVFSVVPRGDEALLTFGRDTVRLDRVRPGNKVWKTSDPELDRRLRQTFAGDPPRFQRPIEIEVHGRAGEALTLVVRDEWGHVVQLASAMPLVTADRQPLTPDRLREQLGRLGGSAFRLGRLVTRLEGEVMLPVSELNRLRRDAVARLDALRARPPRWTLAPPVDGGSTWRTLLPCSGDRNGTDARVAAGEPRLIVLVRSLAQLDAALEAGVQTIYCELEDPKKYREVVQRCRSRDVAPASEPAAAGAHESVPTPGAAVEIFVAPPRITKPGEDWILEQVRSCRADGYLVRNYDHLAFFKDARCVGDYSLNVANPLTARYFKDPFKLERLTASYDLNNAQLEALLRSAPPAWFEITVHQHMPLFHMEHCLFCAFLSKGKDYRDCGRPCDRHEVRLRDRVGAEHPVRADAGCRNTVFNALAQTGAEYVARLIELGARHFRVEFLGESAGEVIRTIRMYQGLLRGELGGAQLWRALKLQHRLGVTRGSLDKVDRRLSAI